MPILRPDDKYSARINAALNFGQTNIDASLDAMASAACLSKFHFSRLFQDQLGESPYGFLKRVRLERAASLLSYLNNGTILDIALGCGFASGQHFSNSFTEKFGYCPRKHRSLRQFDSQANVDALYHKFQSRNIRFDPQHSAQKINIVKAAAIRVAYIRIVGNYRNRGNFDISTTTDMMVRWARKQKLHNREVEIIGVSWDYSSLTPEHLYRYDICVQIPYDQPVAANISTQMLPGGYFATMQTTWESTEKTFLDWKQLDLTLCLSSKFSQFRTERNIGPWYEIYQPEKSRERLDIEMWSRLIPRTSRTGRLVVQPS